MTLIQAFVTSLSFNYAYMLQTSCMSTLPHHIIYCAQNLKFKSPSELTLQVVFTGLVQSGFLPPKQATMDCNWFRTNPDIGATELDHLGLAVHTTDSDQFVCVKFVVPT